MGLAQERDIDIPIGEPDDIRHVPIDLRSSWKFSTASGTPPVGETYDAVADRDRRAVRIGVPLSALEGLIGNECDIRRRVADFETAEFDRLYVEILELADLEHIDYFASAVGLTGAARDDIEPAQTE